MNESIFKQKCETVLHDIRYEWSKIYGKKYLPDKYSLADNKINLTAQILKRISQL